MLTTFSHRRPPPCRPSAFHPHLHPRPPSLSYPILTMRMSPHIMTTRTMSLRSNTPTSRRRTHVNWKDLFVMDMLCIRIYALDLYV